MSKILNKHSDVTADQAFEIVEELACEETDGHFTLMRFTTGWKAMFRSPDVIGGGFPGAEKECEYDRILNIPMEDNLVDAIYSAAHDWTFKQGIHKIR
jgi:hypothetical protein